MSVKERLKKYIEFSNMTIKAFETSIEVSNGYVNSMSKSIGLEKLQLILEKYSNLDLEWLITGKGEMIRKTESKEYDLQDKPITVNETTATFGDQNKVIELEKVITFKDEQIEFYKDKIHLLEEKLKTCEQEKKVLESTK